MIRILLGVIAVLCLGGTLQSCQLQGTQKKLTEAVAAQKNPQTGALWKDEAQRDATALVSVRAALATASATAENKFKGDIAKAKEAEAKAVAQLNKIQSRLAALQERSNRESAANDAKPAFDADSVRRIAEAR